MSRFLVLDNHDSYTYNLVHLCQIITGYSPIVLLNDADVDTLQRALQNVTHILISPGPGTPKRRGDLGICNQIFSNPPLPVFGVCLGLQGLAYHNGIEIIRAQNPMHGVTVQVKHDSKRLFKGIPDQFSAVRYNSLVADADQLHATKNGVLEVTASDAKTGEIMGLRHTTLPIETVQFHPESICSEFGHDIMKNFLQMFNPDKLFPSIPCVTQTSIGKSPQSNLSITIQELDSFVEPEELYRNIYLSASDDSPLKNYMFWLDSSLVSESSRYSYICDPSGPLFHSIEFWINSRTVEIRNTSDIIDQIQLSENKDKTFFDFMSERIQRHHVSSKQESPFAFTGGYCGYFSYEMKEETKLYNESNIFRVENETCDEDLEYPAALFMFFDRILVFDNVSRKMWAVYLWDSDSISEQQQWMRDMLFQISNKTWHRQKQMENCYVSNLQFNQRDDERKYVENVDRCKEYILDGESYELCLTNQIRVDFCLQDANLDRTLMYFDLYSRIRQTNPAPYSSFINVSRLGLNVLCSSPERFVRIDSEGWVECKPIKGTISRCPTNAKMDEENKETLRTSIKDRAENLMIVDLIRNDLTRTCVASSVSVPKLMEIESFATVHHMVSTVRGNLKQDCSPVECIRNAFPPGSMTGAPKKRSMDILSEIEISKRGIYSGCIGYFSVSGASDFNVVIRTMVCQKNHLQIGCGGAVIILSDSVEEYQEMKLKAKALVNAISSYFSVLS